MLVTDPLAGLPDYQHLPTAELDELIAELASAEIRPTPAHRLARSLALSFRFERDQDPATLARALDEFESCTYRGPARAVVGRGLALRQLLAGLVGLPIDTDRVRAMIDQAGDDPTAPGSAALLTAMTDTIAAYADDPAFDRAAALRRLDEVSADIPPESEYRALLPNLRMALAVKRGGERGSYADSAAAAEYAREMLEREDLDPASRNRYEVMRVSAEGMAAAQRGETGRASDAMLNLAEMVDRMPDDAAGTAARRLFAGAAGAPFDEDDSQVGLSVQERAWRLLLRANSVLTPAMDRQDSAGIRRGIRLLREAADISPPGYSHRPLIFSMLGQALNAHAQLGGGQPALDESLRRLTVALREAGHPGHPIWAPTAMALSLVHRLSGRPARSRESARLGLRGHAWSVLLQAGTDDAASAARDAADDAKQAARWCLLDGDPAGAAAALDAGRCLMLYAATVTMDIPARLRALGRDDLLAGWQRDSSDADLRAAVLTALTGAPIAELAELSVPELLDPPALDEVRRALAELRADVLVYLLAGDDQGPGCAVLVASDSRRPSFLLLPGLLAKGPVARHLDALGTRDAGAADVADGDWRPDLDRLCAWAWPAALPCSTSPATARCGPGWTGPTCASPAAV